MAQDTSVHHINLDPDYIELLIEFAELVAAHEREACAKVCNEREAERTKAYTYFTPKYVFTIKG
jgi:hypothetical protein